MRRRTFLGGCAGAVTTGLAGCGGLLSEESAGRTPPVVDDRPDAVYLPTHVESMEMKGTRTAGDRKVGLFYSYPHRFWTVTGTRTNRAEIQDSHSVHLMASTWDPESGTVLPVLDQPKFTVTRDGDEVDSKRAWPMISQNMGFHFGENMALNGDGTYTVTVEIGTVDGQRVGSFEGKFDGSTTAEFEIDYRQSRKNEITYEEFPDRAGDRAAVDPMSMEMLPLAYAPEQSAMAGSPVTVGTVGDAKLVATVDGSTLVVSPRTPYNRFALPGFSVSAAVDAVGFDGELSPAVGPAMGSHYRSELPERPASGDSLTVTVEGAPSIARHEGYETAFLDRGSVTTSL